MLEKGWSGWVSLQQVDIMFKPTLKRSKLSQISTHQSLGQSSLPGTLHAHRYKTQESDHTHNPDLYIPALMVKPIGSQPAPRQREDRLVSPFCYWDLEYPLEVKQKLNSEVRSRLVGTKYGVFWLVTDNQLHLWRYDNEDNPSALALHRRFQFQKPIRAIAVGHLDKEQCSLFNMRPGCQTMAIGFEHVIDLYTVDVNTLQLRPIQIRLKLEFNQSLDKLQITDTNELYYTGDQGYLTKVSFNSVNMLGFPKVNKSNARPSIFSSKSIWPSFQFKKTKTKIFTQRILPLRNGRVYVLIRKQSEGSYLHRLGVSILKFLSGKIRSQENSIYIEKQIHVYTVTDRKAGTIKFNGVIKNSEIEQKIQENYSQSQFKDILFKNENKLQEVQNNSITNIFINKVKRIDDVVEEKLAIVTNYGLILRLRENLSSGVSGLEVFGFEEGPKNLPRQLFCKNKKTRSTALLLRNQTNPSIQKLQTQSLDLQPDQFQPLTQKSSKLIFSLGSSNLNLLNNGLCFYYDDHQLQLLKLAKHPGHIVERSPQPSNPIPPLQGQKPPSWLIFSKSQITFIRKSQPYEHILTILDVIGEGRAMAQQEGKIGVEEGHNWQLQMNNAMHDVHRILGNVDTCRALCRILLALRAHKLGQPSQQNSKGEKVVRINSSSLQIARQQQKHKTRLANRMRYQTLINEPILSFFHRWLTPKHKQSQPYTIAITEDMEQALWKFLMVYSQDQYQVNKEYSTHPTTSQEKVYRSLPIFAAQLVQLFRSYYGLVKSLSLGEIKRSPAKIKQVKVFFTTFLQFLQEKKVKSYSLLNNFTYYRPQTRSPKPVQLNTTSTTHTDRSISQQRQKEIHPNNYTFITSSTPNNFRLENGMNFRSPTQEISNQICKIIPNVLNTIQLYEILACSSEQKYANLPTIEKFMDSYAAKYEVKDALLDQFRHTDITNEEIIHRFSKILPQLRLQSDIYLTKWVKTITRGEFDKEFDSKFSRSTQIRLTNLNQLSTKLDLSQVKRIKQFFIEQPGLYLGILGNQLRYRKLQCKFIDELIKSRMERLLGNGNDGNEEDRGVNVLDCSVFKEDRDRLNEEWKKWLISETILIRNEISAYLRELANGMNMSNSSEYLDRQKLFDDGTKAVLQQSEQGPDFIKDLITYLRQSSILPQKVYRLSLATSKDPQSMTSSLMERQTKPQFMSSLALLNYSLNKNNKDLLFSNLGTTGSLQQVGKEGEELRK